MLYPLKEMLMQKTLTTIVAPHGMTDLIHANNTGLVNELVQVNTGIALGGHILHQTQHSEILTACFMISSIIHFRHDMPSIKGVPEFVLSGSMVPFFVLKPDVFYMYMVFIHVPNHYRLNWKYMKPKINDNMIFMLFMTLTFFLAGEVFFMYFMNDYMFDMAKSVVIGHMLYEELFIHKSKNNLPL